MNNFLSSILDWSEVWAPLIPLLFLLFHRRQPLYLKPVIIYLWLAWILNVIIDFIWILKKYLPYWLQSNNPFYNIHSIVRFFCFSLFFIRLPQTPFIRFRKLLAALYVIFIIFNFSLFEHFLNPDHLSGNLLSAEAFLLLAYCMQYYLAELRDDSNDLVTGPYFWVVTGLSIYVVVNFFVFLFYVPMDSKDGQLADNMWNVHNIAFIIFCIFITKAFYEPPGYKHTI
jgi:hypothetical protein